MAAQETSREDRSPEKPYEQRIYEAAKRGLEDAENSLKDERRASEEAFAVERFIRYGGNEILKNFGHAATVEALTALRRNAKDPHTLTFLDLTKHLLPHATGRAAFHASMVQTAAESFLEAERRTQASSNQPDQDTASERRDTPIDASYAHSVELVAHACQREDEAHFMPNRAEQQLLKEAIQPLLHCLENNPELGQHIRGRGLLGTMAKLDDERNRSKAERTETLRLAIRALEGAIRKIDSEEERKAQAVIEEITQQLTRLAASAGQPLETSLYERMAPIVRELEQRRRDLQENTFRRTHHLSALLTHARRLSQNT